MNYYYLITGLPDIEIDDSKLTFSVAGFKEEVRSQLSTADAQLMDIFFMKFDNQNLLRFLKNKDTTFDQLGNITKSELEGAFRFIGDDNDPNNAFLPPYFNTFMLEYKNAQTSITDVKWENRLSELYYMWAMECNNQFIAAWYEFNLNLNNILAAHTNRKYNIELEVIGENEVAETIKTSNQRDFGLARIVENIENIQRISDEADLFEREKKIDLLKWQWLDEQTFFNYFSIEQVFAYLIKLEIIERWLNLNQAEGKMLFRELINSLKENAMNNSETVNI